MILNLSHGIKSLLLKKIKLVGNHLQEVQLNSCLQNFRKGKVIKERLWNTSFPYGQIGSLTWMPSTTWSEKSTQDQQAILWNIWMWIWLYGEYSWLPLSEQQFISEMTNNVSLRNVQISSWRTAEQLFGDIEKLIGGYADYWNKLDPLGIDEFVAQPSSSIRHCQGLRLFRLGLVSGKNGRRSQSILEEQDWVVFRDQLLQRTESNWWKADGVRVEDSARIQDSGYVQRNSE